MLGFMRRSGGHVRTLGGKTKYRLIYDGGHQRLEHRVVMERVLGRKLATREIVHHLDGDGLNNDPANLAVMKQADHRREHGGPRKWDLKEAIAMRARGATIIEVADRFGVSQAAVNRGLQRRGFSTAAPPRKLLFDRDI